MRLGAVVALVALLTASPAVASTAVLVPVGTRVPLKFVTPVSSATAHQADSVTFAVVADVTIGHYIVIRSGTRVTGTVTHVKRPGFFGGGAAVTIGYLTVPTADQGALPLKDIVISKGTISMARASAAAASVAGVALLGPVGLLAGALVHGKQVEAPEGSLVVTVTTAGGLVQIASAPSGRHHATDVTIVPLAEDTLVGLRVLTPVDSAAARPGDLLLCTVVGNVVVGHHVVILAGAPVLGLVVRVTPPGAYGQSATVAIGRIATLAADGEIVPLKEIVISRGEISTPRIAAEAAELVGTYALGQVGSLAGALVHGSQVSAPRGTILVDGTAAPVTVRLRRTHGDPAASGSRSPS